MRKFSPAVLGADVMDQAVFNPRMPDAEEGFGEFDYAKAETRARQVYYAPDEWAGKKGKPGVGEFYIEGLSKNGSTHLLGTEPWDVN